MEKINFYTQSSLNDTPELRMVIDVSGNVGIGEFNPTKALEVAGDISFNGSLYQNGSLFQSGGGGLTDLSATSINDLSDISFNSSSTTDGQALVWNSTDGVWEASYAPRTTLTQVITTNIPPEWSQITASSGTPNANSVHGGTIHGDYFYVFGGTNVDNLMYKFHLITRVWSQVSYSTSGTILSELYGNRMFPYGNYVYSIFGSRHITAYPSTNTVLRYDTTNNTLYEVSTSGTTVSTRQTGAIALYNDNGTDYLYYFGGRGSSYYNDMYRLNLSNHSWSSVTTTGGPPDARYYISYTYTSTKLYIYGGYLSSGDHANDTWEFDLTNNTWTQLQDGTGTAPQGSYGAAMVYNNNNLYIFGGHKTTSDFTDETWKFDLSDNTWSQLSLSTTPGRNYGPAYATDSSNNLYIHGGYTTSLVFQSTIWKLTLSESTSVTTNYIQGLDVNGDISFNGSLYQNGALFTGGSTIDETTDVSLNNLFVHGDLSANDASFNNVDISNVLNVNTQIVIGEEMESVIDFTSTTETKIVASDGAVSDYFGSSVAISGNYAIVGARNDDDKGSDSGSAYIFNVTTGAQIRKLVASDGYNIDQFGESVAIDGDYAIVGAQQNDDGGTDSGSAYIFNVTNGTQLYKLVASDDASYDYFGKSVAISGNYAIIGAYGDESNKGSAYIFNVTTGTQLYKLTASDGAGGDVFGYSVAISGNYAIVAAHQDDTNKGSAYIFNVQTGTQLHKLTASDGVTGDQFGFPVAISGNYAIVGAHLNDDNGNNSGAAYIFNVQTGTQLYKLLPSDGAAEDRFGYSVAISGNYAIVGAFYDDSYKGSVYIFNVLTGAQVKKITASDGAGSDYFGFKVAISNNYVIVSAYKDDDKGTDSGSAYIFAGTLISPDAYALNVNGDGLFSGTVTSNGSVLTSDDRIKHNEQPITNALSTISKITPKHYFKTGSTLYDATHNFPLNSQNQPLSASGTPLLLNKDYTIETGIIAQEIRAIPELSFAVQNTTPLGVDYNSIHCTHIAATKELHQLVESQQTTLEEQQNEIEHLKVVNQDTNTQLNAALSELQTIKHYLGI